MFTDEELIIIEEMVADYLCETQAEGRIKASILEKIDRQLNGSDKG